MGANLEEIRGLSQKTAGRKTGGCRKNRVGGRERVGRFQVHVQWAFARSACLKSLSDGSIH